MGTAVKHKFRAALILLLAWSVMLQSVLPAFAYSNGESTGSESKGSGTTNSYAAHTGNGNLCIFLHAGDSREFILDADELSRQLSADKTNTWQTSNV